MGDVTNFNNSTEKFEILLIKAWCYTILSSYFLLSSYVGIWTYSLWKMYLSEMLFSNVSANDDSYCRIMLLLLICLIEIGVNKQVLRGRGVHPFLSRWWNKRMYHFSKAPCVEITWFYILIGFRLYFKDIVSKLVYVQIVLKWEYRR